MSGIRWQAPPSERRDWSSEPLTVRLDGGGARWVVFVGRDGPYGFVVHERYGPFVTRDEAERHAEDLRAVA